MALGGILVLNKIKEFGLFLKEIYEKRGLLWSLSKNDFRSKFAGSFFGAVWQFVIPIVSMFVFWFVFTTFKSMPVDDIPFMAWFVPAYVPWMFFTDCLNGSVNSLYDYSYLVKKIKFRTSMLPMVKVVSSLMINLFFIVFAFVIMLCYQVHLTVYAFQIIYYMIGMIIFCTGLSWLLSSITVLFRDMGAFVNVITQIGFWLTPIFWVAGNMPPWIQTIVKFNPMYYITQGFRNSLIYGVGFWQTPGQTLYFWIITAIVFVGGAVVFRKLRPHFADVL